MQTIRKFLSSKNLLRINLVMFCAFCLQAIWLFCFSDGKSCWGPYWLLPWPIQEAYWPLPVLYENILLAQVVMIVVLQVAFLARPYLDKSFVIFGRILIGSVIVDISLGCFISYGIFMNPYPKLKPVDRVQIENTTYILSDIKMPWSLEDFSGHGASSPGIVYDVFECHFFDLWCLKTEQHSIPPARPFGRMSSNGMHFIVPGTTPSPIPTFTPEVSTTPVPVPTFTPEPSPTVETMPPTVASGFVKGVNEIPAGQYLFAEYWDTTAGTGNCHNLQVDFPTYEYSVSGRRLRNSLFSMGDAPTVTPGISPTIGFLGRGSSREGTAGGGIGSRLSVIQSLPYRVIDTDHEVIIYSLYSRGAIVVMIWNQTYLFEPGQSWIYKLEEAPSPGCHILITYRFTNYGLLDESNVEIH
jgi:hypothetical protein